MAFVYFRKKVWRYYDVVTSCWHYLHSVRSMVYVTVRCPSICPSVLCCKFAAVGPAGRRLLSGAQQQRRAAGECG